MYSALLKDWIMIREVAKEVYAQKTTLKLCLCLLKRLHIK